MKATYNKAERDDPTSEGRVYTDNVLTQDVIFCCDRFKEYTKKFPSWNYETGRFTIVDGITYEGNSTTVIDYCPFCGEKIKYKEIKNKKGKKQAGNQL